MMKVQFEFRIAESLFARLFAIRRKLTSNRCFTRYFITKMFNKFKLLISGLKPLQVNERISVN